MPKTLLIAIVVMCVAAVPAAQAPVRTTGIAAESGAVGSEHAQAEIKDATGQVVGRATLTQTLDGVRIQTTFAGLPAGIHGFHIHETGRCEPPFRTAADHFSPEPKEHGKENPKGRHAGDLPNLTVPENGSVLVDLIEPMVSLRPGPNSLMDGDGSALVVHESRDDNTTDPDGNSGARIACGVITR
jgi:Cu-Zn family superoxide dismutase